MMPELTVDHPLILASESPRRRELLAWLGLEFQVRAARILEVPRSDESPVDAVQRLAHEKALAIARLCHPGTSPIVVGADTIVVLDGVALGKPVDATEAESTLRRLRNRQHDVYTALSLVVESDADSLNCLVRTSVPMRNYTDKEILRYVRSGDPLDKAGAYAIQHPGFRPVADFRGCYANVMGLPLCHLAVQLSSLGIKIDADVPEACQSKLDYLCPEYPNILDRRSRLRPLLKQPVIGAPLPARAQPSVTSGATR